MTVTDEERIAVLRELQAEWDDEYEKLTTEFGAYGEKKLRAAYRLASRLVEMKADELELS